MSDKQWHGYYPEPLREAPEVGTMVYVAQPDCTFLYDSRLWDGADWEVLQLQRGRLHLTREAAEAHARFEIEQAGGFV